MTNHGPYERAWDFSASLFKNTSGTFRHVFSGAAANDDKKSELAGPKILPPAINHITEHLGKKLAASMTEPPEAHL